MEGGQVLAVLQGVAGAAQNLFSRVIAQGLQPQLLDLVELFRIRVGGVKLVVIVEPEQGEHLIDGVDLPLPRGLAAALSSPSYGRRGRLRGCDLLCDLLYEMLAVFHGC